MFTCGMVTVDTSDGVAMRVAYGWAFYNPIRKIYYNLTVTVISVLVAWVDRYRGAFAGAFNRIEP